MTAQRQKKFHGSVIVMLLSVAAIVENAIAKKAFLQSKRTNWADPFFENLRADIDTVVSDHLGIDSARGLRQATQQVHAIQEQAITLLSEFKVQVEEDFKNDRPRRTEILKDLGFSAYLKKVQRRSQEALISLLYQFQTNMDAPLQAEITGKGVPEATISTISSYAQVLKDKSVTQEAFKSSRKELTANATDAFNDIYSRVISVARMSARFYKADPAVASQFSYARIKAAVKAEAVQAKTKAQAPAQA